MRQTTDRRHAALGAADRALLSRDLRSGREHPGHRLERRPAPGVQPRVDAPAGSRHHGTALRPGARDRRHHLITAGLWLCGAAGSDFFFLFFFVVFLSAVGERPELTALGAGLAAAGYLLLLYRGPVWHSAMLLRVPFLFATGLTYGFLVGKAREARARASAAEQALGTMSHEIRSPLSAIIRYSEALRTDRMNNLTAAQRAGIAQINQDAVELLELTVQRLAAVVRETPTVEDCGAAQKPASGRGARPAPLE